MSRPPVVNEGALIKIREYLLYTPSAVKIKLKDIAKQFNISIATVYKIKKGEHPYKIEV